MRLFAQTLTGISVVTLFSFGGAWAAREVIVKPHLLEIAAQADRKDLRRALLALDGKQQQLVALAYDRAMTPTGDNAYAPPVVETFIALNIDYFAEFNRHDEPLRWLQIDNQQSVLAPTTLDIRELQPYLRHSEPRHSGAPVFTSGWMQSTRGPLLYALASTHDRSVLFGADIDEEFTQDLREATQLNISLSALTADSTATQPQQLEKMQRDGDDSIHWIVNDTLNRPTLQLTLKLPPRTGVSNLVSTPLIIAFLIALIGSLFMLGLVERALILPVRALGWHLRRVRQIGDYNLRLKLPNKNELGELSQELNNLVEHVQTQQLQLIAQSRELQALSYQDSLTTLANRRRFDQALADNWAMAQRMRKPLALIMCDVDYFKAYNDHYGHQKGDEILRQLAHIISQVVVRTSDLATRFGGEEFAVLLPNTTEEGALHLAQQLQQKLQTANISHEYSHICRRLTLSIGVAALVPAAEQGPRDLVRMADEALYAAKAAGRNRIEMATGLL
jgi:diguanylate cyclase (GGDEF)-like protein